jgi:cysteine desulfurase/selenocysteine lyase
MAKEIERLAKQFFQGGAAPGPNTEMPLTAATLPAIGGTPPLVGTGAIAPPHLGPNAANLGAGGVSPAVMLPPIPGPAHQLPLAATPPPKESDLRAIPTQLSEHLGFPSPIASASGQRLEPDKPYFLGLAGMPSTSLPLAGVPAPSASPIQAPGRPAVPSQAGDFMLVPLSAEREPVPTVPDMPAAHPAASPPLPVSSTYEFQPEISADLAPTRDIFDANTIRRDFPILEERIHGRRLVWLDNAATTQKPRSVIDRLTLYYERENSNVHRAAHTLAARATDAFEGARERVRRFVNAPSVKGIVFVRGATEAINLVAQSWGRRNVGPGDEIVITWLEHHSNIVPWQQLCSEKGARLRVAPVDDRGQVILDEYERLLGPRTRLVSLTQVSNALGTIVPAKEMIETAHRYGARVLVDGAQSVLHMPVDVQRLDCDWFVFSGHKVFGPTGIGALYGKSEVLETMPPWQGGGSMITDVTFEKSVYQSAPARFEAGTGNIADAVGLGAALDYVSALGLENVSRYEHELLGYAEEQLLCIPGLRMIGTAPEKAGVMSFVIDGVRTEDVGAALDQEGIAVRSGHHCAQPILRRFGLESSVRASLAPYNTRQDVDALVAALERLQTGRPSRVR